jgi:hypothetical protein
MYIGMLHNQVLGVDNPQLLHEIHNIEDYPAGEHYTHMQRKAD